MDERYVHLNPLGSANPNLVAERERQRQYRADRTEAARRAMVDVIDEATDMAKELTRAELEGLDSDEAAVRDIMFLLARFGTRHGHFWRVMGRLRQKARDAIREQREQ